MKKLLTILLTVAMLIGIAAPAAAESALIAQNYIDIRAMYYEISTYEPPALRIYVYASNETGRKVWVSARNAEVDGIPVGSAGLTLDAYTEYGDYSEYILLMTDNDNPDETADAIRNARKVEMDLIVMDDETYEQLIEKHISLDLYTLDTKASFNNNSESSYSYTYKNSPPEYTPASSFFYTLSQGDKGQSVVDLQQRLNDLGYRNTLVDGVYGEVTAVAVMSFCTQNGLDINGSATPEMQRLLYSSNCEYYEEPYIPLIMGPSFYYFAPYYVDLDNGTIYFQVVNRTADRTIRAYELYYYFEDVWGNRYSSTGTEGVTRKTTITQTIEPGYIVYSDPVVIYPYSWTYSVFVGIHKIIFDDGEIREIDPDDIQYFSCVIK